MDLSEGVEGGTDYSGILAGACHTVPSLLDSLSWAYLWSFTQYGKSRFNNVLSATGHGDLECHEELQANPSEHVQRLS